MPLCMLLCISSILALPTVATAVAVDASGLPWQPAYSCVAVDVSKPLVFKAEQGLPELWRIVAGPRDGGDRGPAYRLPPSPPVVPVAPQSFNTRPNKLEPIRIRRNTGKLFVEKSHIMIYNNLGQLCRRDGWDENGLHIAPMHMPHLVVTGTGLIQGTSATMALYITGDEDYKVWDTDGPRDGGDRKPSPPLPPSPPAEESTAPQTSAVSPTQPPTTAEALSPTPRTAPKAKLWPVLAGLGIVGAGLLLWRLRSGKRA